MGDSYTRDCCVVNPSSALRHNSFFSEEIPATSKEEQQARLAISRACAKHSSTEYQICAAGTAMNGMRSSARSHTQECRIVIHRS